MPSSDYAAIPSTGKLKLKGGPATSGDSKISKKKKKSKTKDALAAAGDDKNKEDGQEAGGSSSALSKALRDEDRELAQGDDGKEIYQGRGKTEAEKRWEEQRRKRLDERLKREGMKSHKERVEELNRYLSGLSEHHDMPRIGPG